MILTPKTPKQTHFVFDEVARDKSLSHRSVIFAFLCEKPSRIWHFLQSADTLATLEIAKSLGMQVQKHADNSLTLTPPKQIKIPSTSLQCHNSGTSMRLYMGLLAGEMGKFCFVGDDSLSKRPMQRVRDFLEKMGTRFFQNAPLYAPFAMQGARLQGMRYVSPVPSAQLKSAFLLASLRACGESEWVEPSISRDHSERMLLAMGANLQKSFGAEGYSLKVTPLEQKLSSLHFTIPNDPSSVMFLIVGCLIGKNLQMTFKDVLLNPTRIYAFEVLKQMGAKIEWEVISSHIEPIGEVRASSSVLEAVEIKENIACLIDEIPALCIACACAKGASQIRNAKELRIKESDRICAIASNLVQLGIAVKEFEDGLQIVGGEFKEGERVKSFGDHRIAMSFALVGFQKKIEIDDVECVKVSFPLFFEKINAFVECQNGS